MTYVEKSGLLVSLVLTGICIKRVTLYCREKLKHEIFVGTPGYLAIPQHTAEPPVSDNAKCDYLVVALGRWSFPSIIFWESLTNRSPEISPFWNIIYSPIVTIRLIPDQSLKFLCFASSF